MIRMYFKAFAESRDDTQQRLLDVREQDEYNQVHVHGAELFLLSRLRQGEMPEDDGRQLVLICRSGARSAMAGQYLEGQGFKETINIEDGTLGAIEAGQEHVNFPQQS